MNSNKTLMHFRSINTTILSQASMNMAGENHFILHPGEFPLTFYSQNPPVTLTVYTDVCKRACHPILLISYLAAAP